MIEATNEFDGWTKRGRRFRTPYGKYEHPHKHAFRMVLEIPVTGQLNMDLWRALKVPPGWKKNARQRWKNEICIPVRFISYDAATMLTPDQVEALRCQVLLMVRA